MMPISTPHNSRPALSLGGFARTLMSRPSVESKETKTEDDLSPESLRKLMFFQKRSTSRSRLADSESTKENTPEYQTPEFCENSAHSTEKCNNGGDPGSNVGAFPKLVLESSNLRSTRLDHDHRAISSSEEDIPKVCSSTSVTKSNGVVKETSTPSTNAYAETIRIKSELFSAQKSHACSDSGIASCVSGLSLTEALDLSVGSTNKHASVANLQTIKENSESPSAARRLHCPEPKQSPGKFLMASTAKSEGCIYIPADQNKVNKRSPPLRLVESALPPVLPRCVVKIPTVPTPRSVAQSRCRSSDDINIKPRSTKPIKKFGSLRGTPKQFNALKEVHGSFEGITQRRIVAEPTVDAEVVQGKKYIIKKQLGKGGSGEVSLVEEVDSKSTFALKRVSLNGINEATIKECINEIQMLVELKETDLVIKIAGWEINRKSLTMKIVMELGQYDLGFALKDSMFTVSEVKATWERMLTIVAKIHERGIVHSDLKPANFVYIGRKLKIIDFGIAARLQNDHTSIDMLNPKGTLNYISPETICPDKSGKMKIGPKSDIWSLGCILYLMVYGKTPFQDFPHYLSKVTAISKGQISYPPLRKGFERSGVDTVLRACFTMDHRKRPTAVDLLDHIKSSSTPFYCPPES